MKIIIILCFFYNIIRTTAFNCPNATGIYVNPNDYQSYYVCDDNCPHLEYCQSPTPYFSTDTQRCSVQPSNWIPRYYLSGTLQTTDRSGTILYVLQDGYKLLWTFDHPIFSETITGRYINETYVRGIGIRRFLSTNCINVFDIEIIASADREFCRTHVLHPQSALCDLTYPHSETYCNTLSF